MTQPSQDEIFMQAALAQAQQAAMRQEVPVGAVLVHNQHIIAQAHNAPITQHDPTAHAEILVLRQAASILHNYRLVGAQLYVTLEPCLMCLGAMVHSRIERLIFGAYDSRTGAISSVWQLANAPQLNHAIHWTGGILANQCAQLLTDFFKARR